VCCCVCSVLQVAVCVAERCSVLESVAVYCSVLHGGACPPHHTPTSLPTTPLPFPRTHGSNTSSCILCHQAKTLKKSGQKSPLFTSVAVCCSVLKRYQILSRECCSVLQRVAACAVLTSYHILSRVLQCVAACSRDFTFCPGVLQRVAVF